MGIKLKTEWTAGVTSCTLGILSDAKNFHLQDYVWQKICLLWPWCAKGTNSFLYCVPCIILEFFCILCIVPCTLDSLREGRPFWDLQKFHFCLKIYKDLHFKIKIWDICRALSEILGECFPLLLRFRVHCHVVLKTHQFVKADFWFLKCLNSQVYVCVS